MGGAELTCIDLFIDPHTCLAVSGTSSQPISIGMAVYIPQAFFNPKTTGLSKHSSSPLYFVSHLADNLMYISGRPDPASKENKLRYSVQLAVEVRV